MSQSRDGTKPLQWELVQNAVRAAYSEAVQAGDPDALPPASSQPVSGPGGGGGERIGTVGPEDVNKALVWVLKKAIGALATLLSGGAVESGHVDPVVDFFVGVSGMPMPKDGEALVLEKLDEVLAGIQLLNDGLGDLKDHVTMVNQLQDVQNATSEVRYIWTEIQIAMQDNDRERLFRRILDIEGNHLSAKLSKMYSTLTDPTLVIGNPPRALAAGLQHLFQSQLQNTNGDWTFGVEQYADQVSRWSQAFLWTERMGTALLVLYERCRPVAPGLDLQKIIKRMAGTSVTRCELISRLVAGEVVDWPSYKMLLAASRASHLDPAGGARFTPLFKLRVPGTDQAVGVLRRSESPPAGPYGGVSSMVSFQYYLVRDLAPDYQGALCRLWNFRNQQDGTWKLYATRDSQTAPECLPFGRWAEVHRDGNGLALYETRREEAPHKIIPFVSGTGDPDGSVQLVLLQTDRKGKVDASPARRLTLSPASLDYPLFANNSEASTTAVRDLVNSKSGTKFHTRIENHTDYILVLTDACSSSNYHYTNTVWLPGDTWPCVGAYGMGCRAIFKFTMYELTDRGHSAEGLGERIRKLFYLLPGSGKPGLSVEGARPVTHLIVRAQVPSVGWNSISAVGLDIDDPKADLVDLETPRELSNVLDENKVSSRVDGTVFCRTVKVELRIEGGDDPSSYAKILKK
ncbi:hypothetical protein C8Q78DRAFT_995402 [Trametes maxima]|nr:hypothetical protein C8Q78DRAFT_995402 [Trametes maxima]